VDKREEGTLASVVASILHGAHIVRVHDVRNAVRAARIADAVKTVSLPEV
jgi:dihydropteroate synthase